MTTENKKKLFWIAGIALAVIYFGHSFIKFGPPLPAGRPASPAQSAAANAAAQRAATGNEMRARNGLASNVPGAPATSMNAAVPPQPLPFDNLLGTWQGLATFSGSTFCGMKLELRRKQDAPDKYAGFPELLCTPASAMGGVARGKVPQVSPMSAVFTGSAGDGAIIFTLDKALGASAEGCSLSTLSVTPFGTDEIAAEWSEGNCDHPQHGQMMLKRSGK